MNGKNLINFHDLDIETLVSALGTVIAVFLAVIWYIRRKEKEAVEAKLRSVLFVSFEINLQRGCR